MRKLGLYMLLAGAMVGLSPVHADEAQPDGAQAVVPMDEVLPVDVLPVDVAVDPAPGEVDPGFAIGEPVPGAGAPTDGSVGDPPPELVDPPIGDGELKPEIGVVDPVDVVSEELKPVDDSQIVTIGGEEVPAEEVKVIDPAQGGSPDGIMYMTGAPVGIEATSGLANPGSSTGDLSRAGVDEPVPAADLPAGFPAPMDVMDNTGSRPRAKAH